MTEFNPSNTETADISSEIIIKEQKVKKAAFRRVCGKIGCSISIFYICKIICSLLSALIYEAFPNLGTTAFFGITMIFQCVFVYFIPILATVMMFNSDATYDGSVQSLYKRPVKSARIFAAFPALYGMGQAVNLLTLLAFYIISMFSRNAVAVEKSFESIGNRVPENIYCALIFMLTSVIIAPIAEEFWVRGVFYNALKPYGSGIAIVISSIVFGLMHSNPQMLFYTTALGLALGYIRYATGSLFAPTIMHALFNLISSVIMLFLSLDTFKGVRLEPNESDEFLAVLFYVYLGIILLLMVIGIFSFLKRIPAVRRVKIENGWSNVSPAKKMLMFIFSIPVLVMLALAADAHFGQKITEWLYKLVL